VTGPLTAHRQRRRRITPNTNTTTTTMISTHNHVDMAASLVGAGQFAVTLLPATRASNSVMARRPPDPDRRPRCAPARGTLHPATYPPIWAGRVAASPAPSRSSHEYRHPGPRDSRAGGRRRPERAPAHRPGPAGLRTRSSASAPLTACGSRGQRRASGHWQARKRAELWTPATAVAPRQPRWRVSWRQQSWSSMSGLNHSDRVPSSVAGRPDPACSRLLGPVRCRCAA
jgi:hypothetical protein